MTARTPPSVPGSGAGADSRLNAQGRGAEWPHLPPALAVLTGMIDIIGVLTLGRLTDDFDLDEEDSTATNA